MIISLSKEYRVRGTEHCWQLEKAVIRKGQRDWAAFKYFSSFGKAVSEACRREIRVYPASSLAEALQAVDKITDRYNEVLDAAIREAT